MNKTDCFEKHKQRKVGKENFDKWLYSHLSLSFPVIFCTISQSMSQCRCVN